MQINIFPVWCFCLSLNVVQGGYTYLTPNDFMVVWNVPIHKCTHLNISLDLWKYNIIYNENGSFIGDNMTIFYKLGMFPQITSSGIRINGGIPQLGDYGKHLFRVAKDIEKFIPNPGFQGFSVIDWEEWRPNWGTNWLRYNVYRDESRKLVRQEHVQLSKECVEKKAKYEFEYSARLYMESAIMIGRFLRPHGIWGFYGFPDCYNYQYLQKYCSEKIQEYNNELSWLYESSSALFPSIYIRDKENVTINSVYVYGKLHEAKRVANDIPIFPYSSVHYRESSSFMSADDLLITIGQVAALGFPGVVLWGGYANFNSREKCENFRDYVQYKLGPTISKIRLVLQQKLDQLEFPDNVREDEWADKIFEFYQTQ